MPAHDIRPTAPALPERRDPGSPYRIAVVCLGNICRSPIAEAVLNKHVARAGLDADVEVVSAGTGDWHVGKPMDSRAAAVLTARGYDPTRHRAQQYQPGWSDDCDVVLAMDASNLDAIAAQGVEDGHRLRLFREFDPAAEAGNPADRDVPDPYYGGDDGFDSVLSMVERTASALMPLVAARVRGG